MVNSQRFGIRIVFLLFFFLLFISPKFSLANDGTYDATVTTESGTYTVPVEVEDGSVTYVDWPNGGNMTVYGAEISDGEASGTNSQGDPIDITIDDYEEGSDN